MAVENRVYFELFPRLLSYVCLLASSGGMSMETSKFSNGLEKTNTWPTVNPNIFRLVEGEYRSSKL